MTNHLDSDNHCNPLYPVTFFRCLSYLVTLHLCSMCIEDVTNHGSPQLPTLCSSRQHCALTIPRYLLFLDFNMSSEC